MEQIKEQEMVPYVGDFCPCIEEDEPTEGVKPALNRTVRCEGKGIGHCGVAQVVGTVNFIEDEETRKFFTDDDGVYHSVVFTDPDTGERRFG